MFAEAISQGHPQTEEGRGRAQHSAGLLSSADHWIPSMGCDPASLQVQHKASLASVPPPPARVKQPVSGCQHPGPAR